MNQTVLQIENLRVTFNTPDGEVAAVNGIDLNINTGDCVGIVGESGSGKSQMFLAVMGLLASNGAVSGSVCLMGQELIDLPVNRLQAIRGNQVAMIFQDTMTSLAPHLRIERQLSEVLEVHRGMSRTQARAKSLEMLQAVRIPEAEKRLRQYPHELSGGMRQRVMIAMALLCDPQLLIADEPTTALDVTVQADVLDLFDELRRELGVAVVMITHDLGVVADICDSVAVMYAGRVVEQGAMREVFQSPQHPYTQGLLRSTPRVDSPVATMVEIPGQPPNLLAMPEGCAFRERCAYAMDLCASQRPSLASADGRPQRSKACHLNQLEAMSR